MLGFPRSGLFAGAQPDDNLADPNRLAGLQRQITTNAVSFVQKAQNGYTFLHWCRAL